jgi:hypothetical protein
MTYKIDGQHEGVNLRNLKQELKSVKKTTFENENFLFLASVLREVILLL